jgi:hypothetical protein
MQNVDLRKKNNKDWFYFFEIDYLIIDEYVRIVKVWNLSMRKYLHIHQCSFFERFQKEIINKEKKMMMELHKLMFVEKDELEYR